MMRPLALISTIVTTLAAGAFQHPAPTVEDRHVDLFKKLVCRWLLPHYPMFERSCSESDFTAALWPGPFAKELCSQKSDVSVVFH